MFLTFKDRDTPFYSFEPTSDEKSKSSVVN